MEEVLLKRRERLKREIEAAENLLKQNLEEASFKSYLSFGTSLLPGILSGFLKGSAKPLTNSEVVNSEILSSKHHTDSGLQLFSTIVKAITLMRKS